MRRRREFKHLRQPGSVLSSLLRVHPRVIVESVNIVDEAVEKPVNTDRPFPRSVPTPRQRRTFLLTLRLVEPGVSGGQQLLSLLGIVRKDRVAAGHTNPKHAVYRRRRD